HIRRVGATAPPAGRAFKGHPAERERPRPLLGGAAFAAARDSPQKPSRESTYPRVTQQSGSEDSTASSRRAWRGARRATPTAAWGGGGGEGRRGGRGGG